MIQTKVATVSFVIKDITKESDSGEDCEIPGEILTEGVEVIIPRQPYYPPQRIEEIKTQYQCGCRSALIVKMIQLIELH